MSFQIGSYTPNEVPSEFPYVAEVESHDLLLSRKRFLSSSFINLRNAQTNLNHPPLPARSLQLLGHTRAIFDWEKMRVPDDAMTGMSRKLRQYYGKQNALIDCYKAIDQILDSALPSNLVNNYGTEHGPKDHTINRFIDDEESAPFLRNTREDNRQMKILMIAIYVNLAANMLLLIAKIVVALSTSSLSIIASLVDSVLDFASTVIIYATTKIATSKDWRRRHLYPIGQSALQPLGVLVFAILMVLSFLQVGVQSVKRLLDESHVVVDISESNMLIMGLTVLIKGLCWLGVRSYPQNSVRALAQDAQTDVVFNAASIMFPVVGKYTQTWWLDPLGAIILSAYVVIEWGKTFVQQLNYLTGMAPSLDEQRMILYCATRFSEKIIHIMSFRAYHIGEKVHTEIDVVLEEGISLRDAHDIGESLQYSIETLPFVQRCFVHLDYRASNPSGHINR